VTVANYTFVTLSIALFFVSVPSLAQNDTPAGEFTECADAGLHSSLEGTECARIEAPLDYAHRVAGKVELFVRKFPAQKESEGQLWMVAGGPGESGASFYPFIQTVRAAAPGFDLLIPDHRGTGFSTRLCAEEEDPLSEGGGALVGEEWGACFGALNAQADRTRAFTISNAAHDLDLLMTRFDTGKRAYVYGVSYGTQLILRMLTLGMQDDLDGVILDSLVPLESNGQLDLSHRSAVTDSVGREVLRECDERPDCRRYFPGSAEEAVRLLLNRSDIEELAGARLKYRLSAMLDFPATRAMLPNVIAGLQAGDPSWLEHATDELASMGSLFEPYAQGIPSIPLVSLISSSENNARPTLTAQMVEREEEQYIFASPLPSLLLSGGIPTYEPDTSFGKSPKRVPPMIVLHGTLDPKTPYQGAQEHVAVLEAAGNVTLVPVARAPHFVLMAAPDAFERSVRAFIDEAVVAP